MKKFLAFIAVIIVIYSVYIDLNFGTIPFTSQASAKIEKTTPLEKQATFKTTKVKPGETVLSIIEKINTSPLSISIERMVKDFEQLNNGMKPEEIQIGQVYKFPIYDNQ